MDIMKKHDDKQHEETKREVKLVAERLKGSASPELAQPFLQLFANSLKDMYKVEKHLVASLSKVANAGHSPELRAALANHLKETEGQVARVEKIFSVCELEVGAGKCEGLEGITTECDNLVNMYPQGSIRDAALIMAAEKIEHYEIAGYNSLLAMAQILHLHLAVPLLQESLDEEEGADKLLKRIAKTVNELAAKEAHGSKDGQH